MFSRATLKTALFSLALAIGLLTGGLFQMASADNLYGSIRGKITDPTGAIITGAKVTATNSGTGIVTTVTSSEDGSYAFLQLAIGDYVVRAEKSGFQAFEARGVHIDVNQVYQLEIKLEVGAVTSTVTVEANPVQVNTTSAQLGTVVDSNFITDIPLIGRNWVNLQQMQPGVVSAADGRGDFATNGRETQQNSYLINGTDTNDLPLNTPLIIPSPDSIDEFRMVTNVINPEYGRNSGAVINAITKAGTNQFHGDAFEFYRDPFLNTRNFFAQTPAVFHQNQFGGTAGGPIWKNHSFIFFSYQGIRNRQPGGGGNVKVFSPSEATDNFAADLGRLSASNTSPFPLFGNAESPCPVGGTPCAAGTSYTQLFNSVPAAVDAGVVPSEDINPLAAKLQAQFVPLPNVGSNFQFQPINASSQNQYTGRIDQNFGGNDKLWGVWFWQRTVSTQELPFTGSSLPGFGSNSISALNQGTISWSHAFSDHMLNELRGGYTRLNFIAVNPQTPTLPSSFCASNAS